MNIKKKLKTNRRCKNVASDCEASIFRLNDDCLRHVFSFLPFKHRIRIQRVCKRWQRISKLPWSDVKKLDTTVHFCWIVDPQFKYNLSILKQVLKLCGRSIAHVKLPNYRIGTDIKLLELIRNMCPSLRSLDFSEMTITPEVAQFLANYFRALTKIKIRRYSWKFKDSLSQFFANNKCLKYLDMMVIRGNVDIEISKLPESLNAIAIRGADNIHPEHFCNGLQKLSKLRSLMLSCWGLEMLQKFDLFVSVLPNKMYLEELQLSHGLRYKTGIVVHVKSIIQFTNLRKLVLKGVLLIHDEILIDVGHYCKNLRIVHLYDSTNELSDGWPRFIGGLNLEELKLASFDRLSDQCFASLNMPSLKILKCYRCFHFSAETFGNLVQEMSNLERLDVIFCGAFPFKRIYNETLIKNVLAALKTRKNGKTLELHVLNQKAVRNVCKIYSLTLVTEKDYDQWE